MHLENSITQHRPIAVGERLQVTARAGDLRPHAKGTVFDIRTTVHAGGELVWEETSTFLRRGRGDESAPTPGPSFPDAPPTGTVWRLPGDLGRRYAGGLGRPQPDPPLPADRQGARLPAPDRARHVERWPAASRALENRLPDAVRVDVAFKKPILLPGTVAFGSRPVEQERRGYAFSLSNPRNGAPHLAGVTTAG